MPTQNKYGYQPATTTVLKHNPKDCSLTGRKTTTKPSWKVGKVIHSGGQKIGSFPKEK